MDERNIKLKRNNYSLSQEEINRINEDLSLQSETRDQVLEDLRQELGLDGENIEQALNYTLEKIEQEQFELREDAFDQKAGFNEDPTLNPEAPTLAPEELDFNGKNEYLEKLKNDIRVALSDENDISQTNRYKSKYSPYNS